MINYDFTVDKKRFNRRIKSDLQHKLRVVMKCYTILNFLLNETDRSFTFSAKFRQYPSKMVFIPKNKDGTYKVYFGKYDFEEIENGLIKISITVDFKNKIENEA